MTFPSTDPGQGWDDISPPLPGIPDREVVGARAEEAQTWMEAHPEHTVDELMEFYRSRGWLD